MVEIGSSLRIVDRLRSEPEGGAHRRHVDRLRIGNRATPTAGSFHHLTPEKDGPDDPVDAERVRPAASLEIAGGVLGLPRRVDAAMAAASGRDVLGASGPRRHTTSHERQPTIGSSERRVLLSNLYELLHPLVR